MCRELRRQQAADSANWSVCSMSTQITVKPDDHSEVVPPLPIPNRTVKHLSADDSADSRVKVGHRQANIPANAPTNIWSGRFALGRRNRCELPAVSSSKYRLHEPAMTSAVAASGKR